MYFSADLQTMKLKNAFQGAHFRIRGQNTPHDFLNMDMTPTPNIITWTKHLIQILKIRQNTPHVLLSSPYGMAEN